MQRRKPRIIAALFVLGVWLLGACQAPLRMDDDAPAGEPPINDDFAARLVLEGAAGSAAGGNLGATAQEGEPDHGGHPAQRSVWWTWTAPAAGTAAFDARTSALEAVVAAYRGGGLGDLAPVVETDGSDAIAGLVAFEVVAGDVVSIAVDGLAGADGAIELRWTLDEPEPEPDPDPEPEPAFEGSFDLEELAFEGTVGGPAPAPLTAVLTNVGGASGDYGLVSQPSWVSVTPASGTLAAGAFADLRVAVDACTTEGSEAGTVALTGANAAIVVRRDCTTPVALPTLDLALDRVYVNQSVPAQDSARPLAQRVPLVADRPGLLRVFVTANEPNAVRPSVRLHYRYGGGPEATLDLVGPDAVPLAVDEGVLDQTFHVPLDADLVRPGLEAYVSVWLPGEADPSNNRYPPEGYWVPDVVVAPDARFTLVPVTYRGATPTVGDGSGYLDLTERMLPLAGVDVEVRAPYAFTGDLGTSGGWSLLLRELTDLRVADGSDRHYYGVVNPGYGGGIAGIGWVGGWPVAVGWHHLPSGASVATHELGHNWGRSHAPCGVSGDPGYPYPGAVTGVWGYDLGTGELKPPTLADVMSYCSPVWVSDYTYDGVLDYRRTYGYASSGFGDAAEPTTVLLASGRIDGDAVELDPLFVLDGVPSAPDSGPYELVGRGTDGRELLRVAFAAVEVSLDHDRAFQVATPIAAEVAAALSAVAIERDGVVLAERRAGVGPLAASPPAVAQQPDGSVAIAWDARAFAEVLVRDGAGGPVLGRDRTGHLSVRPTGREVELLLSNGVTTQRRTVRF